MAPTIVESKQRELIVVAELFAVTPDPETPGRLFRTKTEGEEYKRRLLANLTLPTEPLVVPVPLYGYR